MSSSDLKKQREILFAKFPPGQVPEAADDLGHLDEVEAAPKIEKRAVAVAYELQQHTLQELEAHLEDKGYHLDNTLMSKLTRALIHYVEDTQLHNLGAPEKRLKRSSQEAYVHAWEHRPHGDHDDTPPEWREYK
ncbi:MULTISPECIES: hypothetical protein [Dechloromonas]|jgi:hypothetical protein|uniref:Uncharacterized protein n=1 Tax=Dechloromonas denitrificans TaxID=281362 RepID=A0A133XL86_9RHOO|nr:MULTISPECIES: hypothetical protein [Dechloromonas]KXB31687.1 hypothetical protein AT959_04830 [Dechloromonas denitrificans]